MKIQILIALLSLPSAYARAGQESHGGNVLLCPGKDPVVLDFYNAQLPDLESPPPAMEDISSLSTQEVVTLFQRKLEKTALGAQFDHAFGLIGDYHLWVAANHLIDVGDQGPAYDVPSSCNLAQAAVRQGDTVYVNRDLVTSLSPSQLGVLVVHEILFYVGASNQISISTPVRAAIRELLKKEVSDEGIYRIADGLGATPFWKQIWAIDEVRRDFWHLECAAGPSFQGCHALFPADENAFMGLHFDQLQHFMVKLLFNRANPGNKVEDWFDCARGDLCRMTSSNGQPVGTTLRFIAMNAAELSIPGKGVFALTILP